MRTLEPREMTIVSGDVLQKQTHEGGAFGNRLTDWRLTDWWSKFTQLDAGGGALEEVLVKASKPGSGGFEEGRIDPASLLASMQLSALTAELGRGGELRFSSMDPYNVERFLEHTHTPPIETKELEKKLEDAMKETDEQLRQQAIMGAMFAVLGTTVLAMPPVLVAAGVTALVAKLGIVLSAAALTVGGTAVLADAIDRLGDDD